MPPNTVPHSFISFTVADQDVPRQVSGLHDVDGSYQSGDPTGDLEGHGREQSIGGAGAADK